MKVRAIQCSPVLGDIAKNMAAHAGHISRAIRDGRELIVFPELSLSGYQLKDIAAERLLEKDGAEWREFERLSKKIDIIVGAPLEEEPGIIYNAALYFSRGKWRHTHRKVQLPNYGMFEEKMIFKAGDTFRTFRIGTMTAGILICREILFPMLAYLYFIQKTDLLIGISNSPQRGIGKDGISSFQLWETMGYVFSQFYHQNYLFVNRVGFEDGIGFGGGSFFARAGQGICQKAKIVDADTLDAEVRPADVRRARLSSNYLRDEQPGLVLGEMQRILHA
ncbi:MAG TPA: nitrilase-related carbon-nitrogen hydrolase [Candidatus Binatia bacterium]|nr:nitrilase-related carbon-nitrogen hydrolase [Candidatus Binatia bacterium]